MYAICKRGGGNFTNPLFLCWKGRYNEKNSSNNDDISNTINNSRKGK